MCVADTHAGNVTSPCVFMDILAQNTCHFSLLASALVNFTGFNIWRKAIMDRSPVHMWRGKKLAPPDSWVAGRIYSANLPEKGIIRAVPGMMGVKRRASKQNKKG